MNDRDTDITGIVDLLPIILCLPFCLWVGWWGILPAFLIGTLINIIGDSWIEQPKEPT